MTDLYLTHTLSNGLRIVHQRTLSKVAYCGLAVNAGSRDEVSNQFGIAHFVEHTIFKGTRNRKAWHILNRMERVGGELNAYTSKEETLIYSIFPAENYARAVELIGDLIKNSIFPEHELAKEREVVLDEIDSYRDIPSEAVYDDFEDKIFATSGLGHNILGMEETLNSISSADCMNFLKTLYVPENMVFFSYGDIDFTKLCRLIETYFGSLHHTLQRITEEKPTATAPQFNLTEKIDTHQSHTIYGSATFSMYDPRKYALALLNNMLAGPGMNSILNVALRERRGYVYTVESNTTLYSDTGLLSIYFGCDKCHTRRCLKIIADNINSLADSPISEYRLDMAKKQYLGQLIVSGENKENAAISLGKSMLYFNRISTFNEIAEHIKVVTPQEISDIARLIAPDNASSLTFE